MKTTKILALILLSCSISIAPVISSSQHLLDAWNEIKSNYINDIQQSYNIYEQIKEEQYALAQLRSIVEKHLRDKNAEQLANALSSDDIINSAKNLKEIIDNITNHYDNQMADTIFFQAIKVSLRGNLLTMPDLLWNFYQRNDGKYFEIMLRLQIQLYNSFSVRHHKNEKAFLQNYAYRLHTIKKERSYDSVDLSLKSSVQNIVDKLPNNLKYLYFAPYFCLLNIKYEKYIYAAIEAKVDPLSRYIWLWYDNKSMDNTGYLNVDVAEYNLNNEKKLKVALKSTTYKFYYYMMPSTNMIAGWDTDGTPSNHIWDLEFVDDNRVVFSQNGNLMCAVEQHDNERRNVGGRRMGQVSSTNSECQWRLGKCTFK
ncbi:uncharacterized protein LOC119605318 [Lucilia sericata]|uniref:uncharacterized protein LOC119605318 n=1 Tax=Lucilia sericata TaxID=13632 RepID=UPI0018A803BE|nr:uncharacterized protein LOC119605318 [Lucilia sericata]